MTTWFIDAIDPRSGFAVATRRQPDLLLDTALTENSPTVFISPPSFEPIFAGTRSMGFALARNCGQLGLFFQDKEVPFDSLVALAEFVRRTYLRGAAGDGTDENSGNAPPLSPEGSESSRSSEGMLAIETGDQARTTNSLDPVVALIAFVYENSSTAKNLKRGESMACQPLPRQRGTNNPTRTRRLVRGALHVFREVYRRRPNSPSDNHFLHWLTALHRLSSTVTRMGLWSQMPAEFVNHRRMSTWIYGSQGDQPFYGLEYLVRKLLLHDHPGHVSVY